MPIDNYIDAICNSSIHHGLHPVHIVRAILEIRPTCHVIMDTHGSTHNAGLPVAGKGIDYSCSIELGHPHGPEKAHSTQLNGIAGSTQDTGSAHLQLPVGLHRSNCIAMNRKQQTG